MTVPRRLHSEYAWRNLAGSIQISTEALKDRVDWRSIWQRIEDKLAFNLDWWFAKLNVRDGKSIACSYWKDNELVYEIYEPDKGPVNAGAYTRLTYEDLENYGKGSWE